jgi:hypothetical protein
MEVEAPDNGVMNAARHATEYAYKTRFGVVATSAANGDWGPARAWCAGIAKRFGSETAEGLMCDIEKTIEVELKWRR